MQINVRKESAFRVYLSSEKREFEVEPESDGAPALKEQRSVNQIHVLEDGEAPPSKETAVFHVLPLGFEAAVNVPMGQRNTGEGAAAWEKFLRSTAKTQIKDWEQVVDQNGEPVPFDPEYMVDGTVAPGIAISIVFWLLSKARDLKGQHLGEGSGLSPKRKPRSGKATRGRKRAARASNSGKSRS